MKAAYPIVMSKGKKFIVVYIPDFKINTQGKDEAYAMEMARDAIGLVGIDMEDENEPLPHSTALANVKKETDSDIPLKAKTVSDYALPAKSDRLCATLVLRLSAELQKN
jgi:predicted RNase H-like HicB family nuclease